MRAVPVPVVWGVALAAVAGLTAVALRPPAAAAPPALSGPLFALRPGAHPVAAVTKPPTDVALTLTDGGCVAEPASAPEGYVRFTVTNPGGTVVNEAEITVPGGSRILGEAEGVDVGRPKTVILQLTSGTYALACPGTGAPAAPFAVVALRG